MERTRYKFRLKDEIEIKIKVSILVSQVCFLDYIVVTCFYSYGMLCFEKPCISTLFLSLRVLEFRLSGNLSEC